VHLFRGKSNAPQELLQEDWKNAETVISRSGWSYATPFYNTSTFIQKILARSFIGPILFLVLLLPLLLHDMIIAFSRSSSRHLSDNVMGRDHHEWLWMIPPKQLFTTA
jgi:hypothetical protein